MQKIISLIILLLLTISCETNTDFVNHNEIPKCSGIAVAFDLSTSPDFEAQLISSNTISNKNYKLLLPLQVTDIKNNIHLSSSVGNYENFTLINFTGNSSKNIISFKPNIVNYEASEVTSSQPDNGVYLIKNGLERTFVYNYDYFDNSDELLEIPKDKFDSLQYIFVKLPLKSIGKEIENGKTTIPNPIASKNNIKTFPGNAKGKLQIRYELKTELTKTDWFYTSLKSIVLILVPVFELSFSHLISNPKRRKIFAISFIIFEVILSLSMFAVGYFFKQYIGFNNTIDFFTSLIVTLIATFIIYKKDLKEKNSP